MGLCGLLLERACCGTSCASFLSEKSRVSSGIVALILRDAKAKGIWTIRREIGIPTELASLVKAQRTKRFVGKAVLPDTAADDEGVVNFTASGIQAGGETYTAPSTPAGSRESSLEHQQSAAPSMPRCPRWRERRPLRTRTPP